MVRGVAKLLQADQFAKVGLQAQKCEGIASRIEIPGLWTIPTCCGSFSNHHIQQPSLSTFQSLKGHCSHCLLVYRSYEEMCLTKMYCR